MLALGVDVSVDRSWTGSLDYQVSFGPQRRVVQMPLKKKDLKRFRETLLNKKRGILRNAKQTLSEDMSLAPDDLPDEMDLASSEYLQSFTFRLRGREKTFLKKKLPS